MTVDPQKNLQQYIDQWQQSNTQYDDDTAYLAQMIQQMTQALASGKTDLAFEIAEQNVMPGAMTVQGDSMGGLGSSMNIGSALQAFTTDTQNDLNAGASMTNDQAAQFIKYLSEAYDDIQNELKLPANQQWLDPTTANNIIQSMTKIANEYDYGNPDQMASDHDGAAIVQLNTTNWINNPTTVTNNKTGQQHIQDLQAAFTQWNNSQSAQSQSLTAQEQFASNTYNQYMNACTDIFQSTQQFTQNVVQHEIAN